MNITSPPLTSAAGLLGFRARTCSLITSTCSAVNRLRRRRRQRGSESVWS